MKIDDDGRLNEKYRHKKSNAKRHGLVCLLSFQEYCQLVADAGIKSSDIGRGKYHLARYGDKGNYEIGNCRFITHQENMNERVMVSDNVSSGLLKYYKTHPGSFTGKVHSKKSKLAIGVKNKISQLGKRNSQFGTCWITRSGINKRINRSDVDLYLAMGWRKGRVACNQYASVV